uniref:Rieske domain-containing protein n=1 Tax=Aegilops tauschii subsp. strangulata TaxID=200361 RepID=A0A453QVZ4_AEGTS
MDPLRLLLPRTQAQPLLPLPTGVPAPSVRPRLVPRGRARRHRNGAARMLPASAVASESPWTEQEPPSGEKEERFDWLDQWYPFAPVEDLDPGAPHGKMVLGIRVVAWYDRGAGEWRVFEDACPHRLAPLSEGRIDDKGRLQCVYHGWCFDGRGACKFIPQAPALGPPVHTNSKACVASYPCVVQNKLLWFYPRAGPEHADVLQRKRPPFIPEIDDPSFVTSFLIRDMPFGYDVLAENLMDPSHVPYAHKGLFRGLPRLVDPEEYDKEGGVPMAVKVEESSVNGFASSQGPGYSKFVAPCTYYGSPASKKSEVRTWDGTSPHDRVHHRPGRSGEEQGDVGLPEELRPVAPQDHAAVVRPHRRQRHLGFRHVPPPPRGAQFRQGGHRELAEERVRAHDVGRHRRRLQELVQEALQVPGRLGGPDGRPAAADPHQGQAHGQVLVARRAVQELQRRPQGHEGARGGTAGGVHRRRRVPRGGQGDAAHLGRPAGRRRVRRRPVLRGVPLARRLHPEELLF